MRVSCVESCRGIEQEDTRIQYQISHFKLSMKNVKASLIFHILC